MSAVKNGDGKNEERRGKAERRACALDGVRLWKSRIVRCGPDCLGKDDRKSRVHSGNWNYVPASVAVNMICLSE